MKEVSAGSFELFLLFRLSFSIRSSREVNEIDGGSLRCRQNKATVRYVVEIDVQFFFFFEY